MASVKSLTLQAIVFLGLCSYAVLQTAVAQLVAPELLLSGRPGQPYVCVVRYYDHLQTHSTTVRHGELPRVGASDIRWPLELAHSGIRVAVAAVGYQPTQIELRDGEQVLATAEQSSPGMLVVSAGEVPEDPGFPELSPFPNAADRKLIGGFLHAVEAVDSRQLVSDLPLANIDWPTLDAYLLTLHRSLGDIRYPAADRTFGDWLVWDGSLGARVYSGRVRFEQGECSVRLMAIDGKLVDVEPYAPTLPASWFQLAPDCDVYIAQAQALLRGLFAGDATGSQLLFSRKYQSEVTVDQVAQLSNELRDKYGTAVNTIRFVDYEFVDEPRIDEPRIEEPRIEEPRIESLRKDELDLNELASAAGQATSQGSNKLLSIDSLFTLDSGKSCIGRVVFAIPSGRNRIGRAHLKSFYVTESLTSAYPGKAKAIRQLLSQLQTLSPTEVADAWYQQLAEPVRELQTLQQYQTFVEQLTTLAGQPLGQVMIDLWAFTEGHKQTTSGAVIFNTGQELQVTLHWLEDRLYGLSFVGPGTAMSTLDLLPAWKPEQGPAAHAEQFWRTLLSGDATTAHTLLGTEFQKNVSVFELQQMLASDDAEAPPEPQLQKLSLDRVRLQSRDQRSSPVALAIYHVATFADGTELPLYCEYVPRAVTDSTSTVPGQRMYELQAFSTDFTAEYPLADMQLVEQFAELFLNQQSKELIALLPEVQQATADPRLLKLFMQTAIEALGQPVQGSPRQSHLRRIDQGTSQDWIDGRLVGPAAEIPFHARFEREQLLQFHLDHSALSSLVRNMQDFAATDESVEQFLQAWHDASRLFASPERLAPQLAANLRTPQAFQRLGELQREFHLELGKLQQTQIERREPSEESNDLTIDVLLKFERGKKNVRLVLAIDALQARIAGIEVLDKQDSQQ